MLIKLDKRFQKKVQGVFGKYEFQVGILENAPHRAAMRGKNNQGSYAGGPVRKKSRVDKGKMPTIAEVSEANRERLGFNYLTEPFDKKSSDIVKFTRSFFNLIFGRSEKRRAETLLQAIVRNPILRGDYGSNSALTKKIKGFDRSMIDTAQLFKAIKAVCKVRGRV